MSSDVEPGTPPRPRECKIADALAIIGDRWSLLIIREIGYGVSRFNDIKVNTGAPREMLTARLRKLEAEGVVRRVPYSTHPPRNEYVLTDGGEALRAVLRSLREWGEEYA